jgi:hypothetical protein
MLEEIAASQFGFWIVAVMIAAVDSSFLLEPGKFAFSISRANQVHIRISSCPFTLRNRELASSFACFPFQLFFISDIRSVEQTRLQTFDALSRLRRLSRQTLIFSTLSAITMLSLILGPCVAAVSGIEKSIMLLFLPLYLLAIAASVLLWRKRLRLGLSNRTVLRISAEIVFCPVLLANISKRISLAQETRLNSYGLAAFTSSPDRTLSEIRENIRYHNGD